MDSPAVMLGEIQPATNQHALTPAIDFIGGVAGILLLNYLNNADHFMLDILDTSRKYLFV